MFRRLEHKAGEVFRGKAESGALAQAVASYLGMLSHANTFALQRTLENSYGGVSEVENSKAYYGAKNNLARPKL